MSEINDLKVYTPEQANQMLPWLTLKIRELQECRQTLLSAEVEIDAIELVSDKEAVQKKVEEYNQRVTQFYSIMDEIHETGCFLKDPDLGLVDFYSIYQGRVVYLCWKLGEPEVAHWHEIGSGYSTRQPVEFDPDHRGGKESSG